MIVKVVTLVHCHCGNTCFGHHSLSGKTRHILHWLTLCTFMYVVKVPTVLVLLLVTGFLLPCQWTVPPKKNTVKNLSQKLFIAKAFWTALLVHGKDLSDMTTSVSQQLCRSVLPVRVFSLIMYLSQLTLQCNVGTFHVPPVLVHCMDLNVLKGTGQ